MAELMRMRVVTRADEERLRGKLPPNYSRVSHCLIWGREGENDLFGQDARGRFKADLVGYAIVPMEQWNRLCDLAEKGAAAHADELIQRSRPKRKERKVEPPAAGASYVISRKLTVGALALYVAAMFVAALF